MRRKSFIVIYAYHLFLHITQKTEVKNQNTRIILYFDSFNSTEVCPEVKAIREIFVTEPKDSVVKIYAYYKFEKARASEYYKLSGENACAFY